MEPTIDELQNTVNQALLESQWATLEELVADNARIIGPKGFMIDRDTWIGAHQDTEYQQVRWETSESELHRYDQAAVRVDVVDSECRFHGETITGRFRVSQTWVTEDGQWQLAAVQYTPLAC